ncbi:MAG: HNH endonuclease signature motif containing protein [Candidatus Limnocylindrales bacterium]
MPRPRPSAPAGQPARPTSTMLQAGSDVADRFWTKVSRGPGCWRWTASVSKSGVGQFRMGRRILMAHRVAWELTYGRPAPPYELRHVCGNMRCVRPDHLLVGGKAGTPASLARPDAVRFWEKVRKGPGCWEWTGSVVHTGVGQFRVRGKMMQSHRFAWTLVRGELPQGGMLRHACGNLRCVRPDHMTLVTSRPAEPSPSPELAI